jgi:superfamily II helicase
VNFFVSDEMSLNDCVDRLDEDEFQHDADLFIFVENDFFQSFYVDNFFRIQFENSRRICINQRLNDNRHAAIVTENENVDFNRMH